jgi:hypothetical protein
LVEKGYLYPPPAPASGIAVKLRYINVLNINQIGRY